MDKERKSYEELLQTINIRSRSSSTAEQKHYQRQLEFLRNIEIQTPAGPYGASKATQLAHLLTEEALLCSWDVEDSSLNLSPWLLWLNELLQNRKQLLGDTQPLLQWLLQHAEQRCRVDVLKCLISLLDTPEVSAACTLFPRLAAIPLSSSVDAALLLVLCQDKLFSALCCANAELQEPELQASGQLANALLQPHYEGRWVMRTVMSTQEEQEQLTLLVAHSLQLLQKITSLHADYAQQHAPELLGLALSNVRCTAEGGGTSPQLPHRVHPAQQAASYGHDEENLPAAGNQNTAAAGRRVKSRKMRSLTKQRNNGNVQQESSAAAAPSASVSTGHSHGDRMKLLLLGNNDYGCRTPSGGDSEGGCTPTSDGAGGQQLAAGQNRQRRQCEVKVRVAALQLLGAVTKQLPRRTLYGYWHVLFPSDGGETKDCLLHIGSTDGNVRCRALALQMAAQLLYGSKPYLSQASSASAPSNYTPFALSLASSVLATYRQLTAILEREYAPPVLTQCLKCLAVLVQATPFDQLQMGIVYEFVPHVKTLTRHVDTSVKVSALLVMEMLVATPRLTQEMACAVGLPLSERRAPNMTNMTAMRSNLHQLELEQQFQQICDSEEEVEMAEEEEKEVVDDAVGEQLKPSHSPIQIVARVRIPRNSWLLRLVLRYMDCPASTAPLRVECLQVILAMTTHFCLLREHLVRVADVLCSALEDCSLDVRLYGARCLDAVGFQMARHAMEHTTESQSQPHPQPQPELQQHYLNFWLRMLPAIYGAYMDATNVTATLRCSLCDALSNMGGNSFERLPQAQRNGLLAFLLGSSSDDAADPLVRAAAVRALAVYVLHPTLRVDLVFVEHAAELALRLTADNQLAVRIKAAWALGNISDALVAPTSQPAAGQPEQSQEQRQEVQELEKERISLALLGRLIEAAVLACGDHDKVRANAVRALGNLLRLLPADEHALIQRAMAKLLDCVRSAGSAKVKWNACYAIGNLVRNRAIFATSASLAGTLFAALSQLLVQHANFKVRINATSVLLQIEQRADFGVHYATVWRSLLEAIERSNALDTFEEYNHRDGLQQQLCLAMAHMLGRARPDDLIASRDALESHLDGVTGTWRRVAYRIVPEQAAPLFTCGSLLQQRLDAASLSAEQRSALTFLAGALRLES
ncbi:HEAT repeat-containing protein 6 [Drosophila grimshawi]|uniref:HEAT repeat-containing protein 6 n=1 Tax=Drosophila grimshawi TaxID=7222 RepID=B4JJA0_DROGR|nr:HEAT repeat-containing protein 6 [Drosophila grimshawi]EDV99652.1 GH12298 [Drosophila grimshawi]